MQSLKTRLNTAKTERTSAHSLHCSWFEGTSATDDFMTDREQGMTAQTRDSFD
jgi:hypothetical protein